MTSVVYVIEAVGLGMVKIGTSRNLENRLADLRYLCPMDIALVKAVPGGKELEAHLHKRFHEHRSHGEWFVYGDVGAVR
jgi:hypothetical protein